MTTIKLLAITPEAETAIGYRTSLSFSSFPIRLGREARTRRPLLDDLLGRSERRGKRGVPNNDFYLFDGAKIKHISRGHICIEHNTQGFTVVDRGSACGTVVGDQHIEAANFKAPVTITDW